MTRYGAQFGPDITFLGVDRCDLDDAATYADADVVNVVGAAWAMGRVSDAPVVTVTPITSPTARSPPDVQLHVTHTANEVSRLPTIRADR